MIYFNITVIFETIFSRQEKGCHKFWTVFRTMRFGLAVSMVFINLTVLSLATEIVCIHSPSKLLTPFPHIITINFSTSIFKGGALASKQAPQATPAVHVYPSSITSGILQNVAIKTTVRTGPLLRSSFSIRPAKKFLSSLPHTQKSCTLWMAVFSIGTTKVSLKHPVWGKKCC